MSVSKTIKNNINFQLDKEQCIEFQENYLKDKTKVKNPKSNKNLTSKISIQFVYDECIKNKFITASPASPASTVSLSSHAILHRDDAMEYAYNTCINNSMTIHELINTSTFFLHKEHIILIEKLNEYKVSCENIKTKNIIKKKELCEHIILLHNLVEFLSKIISKHNKKLHPIIHCNFICFDKKISGNILQPIELFTKQFLDDPNIYYENINNINKHTYARPDINDKLINATLYSKINQFNIYYDNIKKKHYLYYYNTNNIANFIDVTDINKIKLFYNDKITNGYGMCLPIFHRLYLNTDFANQKGTISKNSITILNDINILCGILDSFMINAVENYTIENDDIYNIEKTHIYKTLKKNYKDFTMLTDLSTIIYNDKKKIYNQRFNGPINYHSYIEYKSFIKGKVENYKYAVIQNLPDLRNSYVDINGSTELNNTIRVLTESHLEIDLLLKDRILNILNKGFLNITSLENEKLVLFHGVNQLIHNSEERYFYLSSFLSTTLNINTARIYSKSSLNTNNKNSIVYVIYMNKKHPFINFCDILHQILLPIGTKIKYLKTINHDNTKYILCEVEEYDHEFITLFTKKIINNTTNLNTDINIYNNLINPKCSDIIIKTKNIIRTMNNQMHMDVIEYKHLDNPNMFAIDIFQNINIFDIYKNDFYKFKLLLNQLISNDIYIYFKSQMIQYGLIKIKSKLMLTWEYDKLYGTATNFNYTIHNSNDFIIDCIMQNNSFYKSTNYITDYATKLNFKRTLIIDAGMYDAFFNKKCTFNNKNQPSQHILYLNEQPSLKLKVTKIKLEEMFKNIKYSERILDIFENYHEFIEKLNISSETKLNLNKFVDVFKETIIYRTKYYELNKLQIIKQMLDYKDGIVVEDSNSISGGKNAVETPIYKNPFVSYNFSKKEVNIQSLQSIINNPVPTTPITHGTSTMTITEFNDYKKYLAKNEEQ